MTVTVDEPCLLGAALARRLFRQHVGQQRNRFDIDPLPAIVGHGNYGDAVGGGSLVAGGIEIAGGHHHAGPGFRRREGMVAARHAARDLQVDDTVAHPVAANAFAHHDRQRRLRHRHLDAQLVERAAQAGHVAPGIDDAAAAHLADFVDPVGELVAAIFDVGGGCVPRQIATVHIGDARHQRTVVRLSLFRAP